MRSIVAFHVCVGLIRFCDRLQREADFLPPGKYLEDYRCIAQYSTVQAKLAAA